MRYVGFRIGTALTFRPGYTMTARSGKRSAFKQFESANLWLQLPWNHEIPTSVNCAWLETPS